MDILFGGVVCYPGYRVEPHTEDRWGQEDSFMGQKVARRKVAAEALNRDTLCTLPRPLHG
jgi:hypothetical protein